MLGAWNAPIMDLGGNNPFFWDPPNDISCVGSGLQIEPHVTHQEEGHHAYSHDSFAAGQPLIHFTNFVSQCTNHVYYLGEVITIYDGQIVCRSSTPALPTPPVAWVNLCSVNLPDSAYIIIGALSPECGMGAGSFIRTLKDEEDCNCSLQVSRDPLHAHSYRGLLDLEECLGEWVVPTVVVVCINDVAEGDELFLFKHPTQDISTYGE